MADKINFAWPVTSENADVYHTFTSKVKQIKDIIIGKKIIIFGAGIRGCSLMQILEKKGIKDIIFCDNNPEKQGHLVNEYDIISLDEAIAFTCPKVFLISPENSSSMANQLSEKGLHSDVDYFSFDAAVYDLYVEEYIRPVSNHMLVMGDCAFTHISTTDVETDSMGKMMKSRFEDEQCKVLAMHGLGQRAHHHIAESLLDKGEKPLLLLLLVMEALTPKAHLMPRTQHPLLLEKVLQDATDPNGTFAEYATIASERFNRFQVESFASFDTQPNEANEKLFMKMNYLFKIKEETEGVVYLKKTIARFNSENIPVVLYIPPVNYELGEYYFGDNFKSRYTENFTKLYSFLNKENLQYNVADASFLLSQSFFAAANTIDETTNFDGRVQLVDFLSEDTKVNSVFTKSGDK